MGVAGAGKTTVGQAAAEALGWAFEDADDYHAAASLRKMERGEGLTDEDRGPWLDRLAALVRARRRGGPPTVLACSALKVKYRGRLGVEDDGVRLAWLDAPAETLHVRLRSREKHVAGPELLESQLGTLEPPTDALRLDATAPVSVLVEIIVRWLRV